MSAPLQARTQALQTGHVGLNVSDLDRSTQFYQRLFGFEVQASSPDGGRRFAMLSDGQRLVLTLWEQSTGSFPTALPGLHHLSFQVGSIEEVRTYEARLREMGARFLYDSIVPHGEGTNSGGIFFTDPDGIRLEIFSPTGASDLPAPTEGAPSCGFF